MAEIAVIGLDLAKTIFQFHGVSAEGEIVVRRQLRRSQLLAFFERLPRCLIGMEACASGHYWRRELTARGHEVKLMPPAYVKAYVKRGKTDAADAEAIAEAVTRPTMRFVPIKSKEQQAALMLHKTRDLLIRQRTMLINALRGHLGEYGIVAARGPAGVRKALASVRERHEELPPSAIAALQAVAHQLAGLDDEISELERRILAWHQASETSRRLATIPGTGADHGDSDRSDGAGSRPVPVRTAVCGLARSHAWSEQQRGQGTSSWDQSRRRRLHPPPDDRWGDCGPALRPPTRRRRMDRQPDCPKEAEGRGPRRRQQVRPHRMGADCARRSVHAAGRLRDRRRHNRAAASWT